MATVTLPTCIDHGTEEWLEDCPGCRFVWPCSEERPCPACQHEAGRTELESRLRRLAELRPEHRDVLLDAAHAVWVIAGGQALLRRRLAAIDLDEGVTRGGPFPHSQETEQGL